MTGIDITDVACAMELALLIADDQCVIDWSFEMPQLESLIKLDTVFSLTCHGRVCLGCSLDRVHIKDAWAKRQNAKRHI